MSAFSGRAARHFCCRRTGFTIAIPAIFFLDHRSASFDHCRRQVLPPRQARFVLAYAVGAQSSQASISIIFWGCSYEIECSLQHRETLLSVIDGFFFADAISLPNRDLDALNISAPSRHKQTRR